MRIDFPNEDGEIVKGGWHLDDKAAIMIAVGVSMLLNILSIAIALRGLDHSNNAVSALHTLSDQRRAQSFVSLRKAERLNCESTATGRVAIINIVRAQSIADAAIGSQKAQPKATRRVRAHEAAIERAGAVTMDSLLPVDHAAALLSPIDRRIVHNLLLTCNKVYP